jgi:hypothetical protein
MVVDLVGILLKLEEYTRMMKKNVSGIAVANKLYHKFDA